MDLLTLDIINQKATRKYATALDLSQLSHWCGPGDKKAKRAVRKRELSSWLDATLMLKEGRGASLQNASSLGLADIAI